MKNKTLFELLELGVIKHDIGEVVYLKTDKEQLQRIVTGINIRQTGVSYGLTNGAYESWHYDFEINTEKDIMKSTEN